MDAFNWVWERSECSTTKAFERLLEEVKADVAQRNKIARASGDPLTYTVIAPDQRHFTVRVDSNQIDKAVKFELLDEGNIRAGSSSCGVNLTAVAALDDDGACCLRIKDHGTEKEFKFWQFRMRALDGLFYF